MSKQDESRREVLADKYPEMEQHFEQLKKQAFEPKIERFGETKKEQRNKG